MFFFWNCVGLGLKICVYCFCNYKKYGWLYVFFLLFELYFEFNVFVFNLEGDKDEVNDFENEDEVEFEVLVVE